MTPQGAQEVESGQPCACLADPQPHLEPFKELGMDGRFAEVSILRCRVCGRHWLRYFYEMEAFTGSGRWYLGQITPSQAATIAAEDGKSTLEGLEGYFYGGSFFYGRSGRSAGPIT